MVLINLALSVSVSLSSCVMSKICSIRTLKNQFGGGIVTQNQDAITSRLMMNVNSLDITANKLSDRLKAEKSSGKLKHTGPHRTIRQRKQHGRFCSLRTGWAVMALFDGGRKLDIWGGIISASPSTASPIFQTSLFHASTGMRFSSSACRSRITGKSWGPYKRSLHSRKCTGYVPSPSFPHRAICM